MGMARYEAGVLDWRRRGGGGGVGKVGKMTEVRRFYKYDEMMETHMHSITLLWAPLNER